VSGGAIYVEIGEMRLYESTISSCSAGDGGGIFVGTNGVIKTFDVEIEDCRAEVRVWFSCTSSV